MKIGTDAVLLGAWTDLSGAKQILDIGTGCGVIALIAAQRSEASIDAIDIDSPSVQEARDNFMHSPWKHRLHAIECNLKDWAPGYKYDIILTNPPYFSGQLLSPQERKNRARHSLELDPVTLATNARKLLHPEGSISFVCAPEYANAFLQAFREKNFYPHRTLNIRSYPGKPVALLLKTLKRGNPGNHCTETMVLYHSAGNRSEDYVSLTRSLYL